jgi:hypothetical protein
MKRMFGRSAEWTTNGSSRQARKRIGVIPN